MNFKQLRRGELVAFAGAILVIVSLFVRSYQAPSGNLTAWNTFGPGVALLLAAACAALAMVISALTERSTALPVSIAVWTVLLGLIGVIAALVRTLERPDHASMACVGVWLALAGAVAILLGAWLALRDERPSLYRPATPEPRPRP
jgi:Na+-transporting NADH:ubiquinone oxidoreductase subunit NqrE